MDRVIAVDDHAQQREQHEEEGDEDEDEAVDGEMDDATAAMADRIAAADDSVQGCFAHEDSVYCIAAHGQIACSGDGNDTAVIWNTHTGEVMHTLKGAASSSYTQ